MDTLVKGLQTGKVLKLENDPGKQFRIQVHIPVIHKPGEGSWVVCSSPDAGNDRGFYFLPEIGDEVVVGFINGDARNPIVLGMLYGSTSKPPFTAKDTNNEKGMVTRNKLRIHFSDDTKTITLDTPAGNSISMDEGTSTIVITDQHSNKVTMQHSGIVMESVKSVEIKAAADITIAAGGSIKIKADGNLDLQGANTTVTAMANTVVKGALVQIN